MQFTPPDRASAGGHGEKQQLHAVQMISVDFSWIRAQVPVPGEHIPVLARVYCGLRDFLRNAIRGSRRTEKAIKPDVARDLRWCGYCNQLHGHTAVEGYIDITVQHT
ncbi:hypothetical protein [Citrobacter meridianamericanus]|uniref:hypothetical protein n=1 Tax=Citrobacter meridianamericanus TaxID=2894201 RepID=UPI00351CDB6C